MRRLPHMTFLPHALVHMFGEGAHVLHNEVRMFKDMRIDALQDKLVVVRCILRDNICVIDIAIAKFLDVQNISARRELLCDEGKIVQ